MSIDNSSTTEDRGADFGLNRRQAEFARNWFSGEFTSQAAAYIAAGYEEKSAEANASRLIRNEKIQRFLRHLATEANERLFVRLSADAVAVATVLRDIAFDATNPPQTRISAARSFMDVYAGAHKTHVQDKEVSELRAEVRELTGS